jgi:inositol-polyphosphate multikinase
MARFFPILSSGFGLPRTTLLPILRSIRDELQDLRNRMVGVEMRMVGGSLLVVYEGDWERAEAGLKFLEDRQRTRLVRDEVEGDDDDEEEEDESEEEEDEKLPGVPFVVRLIDFAHTRLKPGEGPDHGVLLGLDTVLRLVTGRIEEVESVQDD